jgi:hypothetical protein
VASIARSRLATRQAERVSSLNENECSFANRGSGGASPRNVETTRRRSIEPPEGRQPIARWREPLELCESPELCVIPIVSLAPEGRQPVARWREPLELCESPELCVIPIISLAPEGRQPVARWREPLELFEPLELCVTCRFRSPSPT